MSINNSSSSSSSSARARGHNGRFAKKADTVIHNDIIIDDDAVIDDHDDRLFNERFTAFKEMFGFDDTTIEQTRRPVLGFVVNIVVSVLGGYAAGYVAAMLAIAALLMTGSVFLMYCVYIISAVIGLIAAMRAGAVASQYVAYGKFEEDYQAAKGWVIGKAKSLGSMFNRNSVEV